MKTTEIPNYDGAGGGSLFVVHPDDLILFAEGMQAAAKGLLAQIQIEMKGTVEWFNLVWEQIQKAKRVAPKFNRRELPPMIGRSFALAHVRGTEYYRSQIMPRGHSGKNFNAKDQKR